MNEAQMRKAKVASDSRVGKWLLETFRQENATTLGRMWIIAQADKCKIKRREVDMIVDRLGLIGKLDIENYGGYTYSLPSWLEEEVKCNNQ